MTIRGRVPRSTQRTHSRPALVGLAVLIAVLAAVLFSASPVNAQEPYGAGVLREEAPTPWRRATTQRRLNVAENEVLVTVWLTRDPQRQVIIPIETIRRGYGASSADYSALPANVTFNSGETSKTILFTATDDTVDDDDEIVYLVFGRVLPTGVVDGFRDETSVTIKDDDRPTSLTVWFDVVKATVVEGGTTTIRVRLSDDPEREIVIPITLAGLGGAIADDYSGVPSSVTFGAGRCYYPTNEEYTCYEDTKRIRFMAVQDSDDDGEAVRWASAPLCRPG